MRCIGSGQEATTPNSGPRPRTGDLDSGQGFNCAQGVLVVKIISEQLERDELGRMASGMFGNMVKAVVDVDRELLAVDAELHADLESLLIEHGSRQRSLWGINLYPEMKGDDFVEFDSLINVRPSQGNRSRYVESAQTRERIMRVIAKRIRL